MRVNIKSVPGRLVRDPETRRVVDDQPLAVDPTDVHWARLIADGDVAVVETEEDPAPDAAPAETGEQSTTDATAAPTTDAQPAAEQPASTPATGETTSGADQAATPATDQPAAPAAGDAQADEEPKA